jgi:quinol monooxygenase YgiN
VWGPSQRPNPLRRPAHEESHDRQKLYLLAEFIVKPEHLEDTKQIFSRLLPTVLQEEGCEAMYTTSIEGNATRLVFFEIFSSQAAHDFHMAQPLHPPTRHRP